MTALSGLQKPVVVKFEAFSRDVVPAIPLDLLAAAPGEDHRCPVRVRSEIRSRDHVEDLRNRLGRQDVDCQHTSMIILGMAHSAPDQSVRHPHPSWLSTRRSVRREPGPYSCLSIG